MWIFIYVYAAAFITETYAKALHPDNAAEIIGHVRNKRQFDDRISFEYDDIDERQNPSGFNDWKPESPPQELQRFREGLQDKLIEPFNPNRLRSTTTPINAEPGEGTTPASICESRCQSTAQYNPVCGDNNVTYSNISKFNCAVQCGKKIRIAAYRACPRLTSVTV